MNTDAYYERHLPEAEGLVHAEPLTEAELSALALHRNPSLRGQPNTAESAAGPGIAWVRPSDLATTATAPALRRGADLQAEVARRARRTPGTAIRASRRVTRSAIARPEPTAPLQEGLGL